MSKSCSLISEKVKNVILKKVEELKDSKKLDRLNTISNMVFKKQIKDNIKIKENIKKVIGNRKFELDKIKKDIEIDIPETIAVLTADLLLAIEDNRTYGKNEFTYDYDTIDMLFDNIINKINKKKLTIDDLNSNKLLWLTDTITASDTIKYLSTLSKEEQLSFFQQLRNKFEKGYKRDFVPEEPNEITKFEEQLGTELNNESNFVIVSEEQTKNIDLSKYNKNRIVILKQDMSEIQATNAVKKAVEHIISNGKIPNDVNLTGC